MSKDSKPHNNNNVPAYINDISKNFPIVKYIKEGASNVRFVWKFGKFLRT